MKNFGKREWLLLLALVLVVCATGLFAVRTVRRAAYWHYHRDEPIQPWMNVGQIAHSYGVPPHVLYQALGLPLRPPDRRPIRAIARAQGRSVEEVTAILQNAIVHSRPPYPPPPPPSQGEREGQQGQRQEPTQGRAP